MILAPIWPLAIQEGVSGINLWGCEMILKKGSLGKEVVEIQKALRAKGYKNSLADGQFGEMTREMVIAFQQSVRLNADGIVGPLTWKALFGAMPEPVINLPIYQRDCLKLFGNPLDSAFRYAWITTTELNFPDRKIKIQCHRVMVHPLAKAFQNLWDTGQAKNLKTYDGCWVVRNARGSSFLSMHAFGLAIDINAAENPFHNDNFAMTEKFAGCFEQAGFTWGGRWNNPDAMHFQIPRVG